MKLKKQLETLLKSAKFELTDKEKELFLPELEKYIKALDDLDNLNLSGLKPSSRPFEVYSSSLREDIPEIYKKDLKTWSPKHQGDYFVITSLEEKGDK